MGSGGSPEASCGLRDLGGGAGWGCPRRVGASPNAPSFARSPLRRGSVSSQSSKAATPSTFVWSPNRSTIDLDFSVGVLAEGAAALDEARLEGMFSRALDVSGRGSGVLRVHSVRRQPPG